jgi:hypothetical protein
MKNLYSVTAMIELGAGLALLCFPSATVELLVGAPLEGAPALTAARVGGAGLLALGVACWLARGDTESGAARGLIVAMLVYNVAAVVVLVVAGSGPPRGDDRLVHDVAAAGCPLPVTNGQSLAKQSNPGRGPQSNKAASKGDGTMASRSAFANRRK